jgi:hypothetical protein
LISFSVHKPNAIMELTYYEKYRLKTLEKTTNIPRWKYFLKIGGLYSIVFFVGFAGIRWMEKKAAFTWSDILFTAGEAVFIGLGIVILMRYLVGHALNF